MQPKFWQTTFVLVASVWISCCCSNEEIICSDGKYVSCYPQKIRVHDVIYGHVVGRNECNTRPASNCTASNGFCEVAELTEGRQTSYWLDARRVIYPPPCGGTNIYIILTYSCVETLTLSGENFALKKPAKQSKTTQNGFATNAVDGRTSRHYYRGSCSHTDEETAPWWRVDLQQRIAVSHVKIANRDILGKRLCGFEIRIGDNLKNNGIKNPRCGVRQHISTNQDGIVSCEPKVVGRYVTIVLPGENKILTLCEVEVYGASVLGNQNFTKLQLVGSNLPYQGHLLDDGTAFCDPMWSREDTTVACIQLGYPGINIGQWNNSIGSLRGKRAVVKRYNCTGTEGSLKDCPRAIGAKETCEKHNAISLTCQPYIRLRGSNVPLLGRVEVFHQGIWGTVCEWSAMTARVACWELGFYGVVLQDRWLGEKASGKVWLRDVNCRGDEKSLVFCPHNNWKNTNCGHYYDRAVKCSICSNALLQNASLFQDSFFNASAARLPDFGPSSARLYSPQPWCLPDNQTDDNQFLEVNLPGIFSLSAVATVGGNLGYVKSYMLSYMVSGYMWKYASVEKEELIFANTNDETHNVIRRDLDSAIHAQKVRFFPKSWQRVPCMRVELCGSEIPRCTPPNITAKNVTSNSVLISWLFLRLPTNTLHRNYSVMVTRDADQYLQYSNITELSFLLVPNLMPYHKYTCTVKVIGLEECFEEDLNFRFQTKEAAPSGPPTNVLRKSLGSTSVTIVWSSPPSNQRNGIVTSYQLCYSTDSLQSNCSSNGNVAYIKSKKEFVRLEGLQSATLYYFRVQARTIAGAGPYSEEYEVITNSGDLLMSKEVNTTAYSFGVQLQLPQQQYRYIQIVVIKLKDSTLPDPPYTFTSDKISSVNESVPSLVPYVSAELSADLANQLKAFVIGDGMNYGLSSRKRQKAEEFAIGYDENRKQKRRGKRSDGPAKAKLFYNRPLEADSIYSAFQRTFIDKDRYYSSFWSEPAKTNMMDTETSGRMISGSGGLETGALIGIGVGASVIFIILAILLIFFFAKQRKKRMNKSSSSTTIIKNANAKDYHFDREAEYDNYAMNDLGDDASQYVAPEIVYADDRDTDSETDAFGENTETAEIYGNAKVTETRDPVRMVPVEEFESYVKDFKKNENFGFDKQFKELPQGICYPCTIAKSPENKPKNRYGNIVSYDDALVPLSKTDSETYINASFIPGVEPKSYIATQGPTAKTVSTFWKMVWEQKSSVIVMLTNLKENDKTKCAKYWTDSSKSFGKITLTFQDKELFPFYVIRKFLLEKGESKRHVTQYHFTAWPDHGVPKYPTQLLAFQHAVRSTGLEIIGPVIVHCSAGVGRTGTFIVIDDCLEKFLRQEQERSVDVFHIVQEMRKCRVNMIQTLEQYILVHEAILEFILCGFNELEGNALEHTIRKLEKFDPKVKRTGFAELFQRLKNFSPVLTKEECKTATLKSNSRKNRTLEIYPADFARVTLSSSSSNSDYINATFVDGYQQKNAYIATDNPLDTTFDEFWQMIYEQRSPLVIMLNNWKEGREKYREYFPTEKGSRTKYGQLHVRLDEHVADKAIIFRKFVVSTTMEFQDPHIVRHFQYTQWPKRGVPEKSDEILQLMQTLLTAQRQNVQGPMVVHCGNGAGRTGTFLTISICMERLKAEQRVDVFQCIKLIRQHRPQFVENELQLKFCYEVLAKFMDSFESYSNFVAAN